LPAFLNNRFIPDDHDRARLFTRRAFLVSGVQGILFSVLLGRLYQLQILDHERYKGLSEKNRTRIRLVPPERGAILDRHGGILAHDEPSHRICLTRQDTESLRAVLTRYCSYMDIPDDEREGLYRQIRAWPAHLPYVLHDHLAWDQVVYFETHQVFFEGLYVDQGSKRAYPCGPATAHLLGYLGGNPSAGPENVGGSGKAGTEKICDKILQGIPGKIHVEVDARNRKIRTLAEHHPRSGTPVRLTVSASLQKLAWEKLQDVRSGAVVVIDVQNGDILACVSVPAYDPNHMASPFRKAFWEDLLRDPMHPLLNKTVQGQYAPGSLFKPIVALAGLASGVVTPERRFFCSGCLEVSRHPFHCHLKTGHGHVDMIQAIRHSCDVYFYELARLVGIQRISQMAQTFGLGQKTAMDFPGEQKGIVPDQEWKWRLRKERWRPAETVMTGIGQGYLLATPLQMAVMLARLANGSGLVQPRLFAEDSAPAFESNGLDPEWIRVIHEAMNQTVNVPGSTGWRSRIPQSGMEMAGKTATVQVRRISLKERRAGLTSEDAHAWHEREHAMFMAWAPVHQPRYGVYVLCEHGGRGSRVAAPIGRDILWYAQKENILGSESPGHRPSVGFPEAGGG
jgi:penicillin-binding protein 2